MFCLKYFSAALVSSVIGISGCSSSTTTTEASTNPTGGSSSTLIVTTAVANDIAWDSVSQRIYFSVPTITNSADTDTVGSLDPVTGKVIASVTVGGNPHPIAVSATGKYVYVGLKNDGTVQRLILPALTPDIKISLGNSPSNGPYFADNIQAAPNGADSTIAVSRRDAVSTDTEGGIILYDGPNRRAIGLCNIDYLNKCVSFRDDWATFQWTALGDALIVASNNISPSMLRTYPVTQSGFDGTQDNILPPQTGSNLGAIQGQSIHYDSTTGLIYRDDGGIIDPINLKVQGAFDVTKAAVMIPDGSRGKCYFIVQDPTDPALYDFQVFDINTHALLSTLPLGFSVVGQPKRLIRWGTNGLAFLTTNTVGIPVPGAIFLITDGSF